MMADTLAKLACRRGNLQNAISTARAVGDFEWVHSHRPELDLLNRKIDALTKVLPIETIRQAREITNAPI